eukprot:scaffold9617_cov20-Tisochrysis_lutea.AAC.3
MEISSACFGLLVRGAFHFDGKWMCGENQSCEDEQGETTLKRPTSQAGIWKATRRSQHSRHNALGAHAVGLVASHALEHARQPS